MLQRFDSTFLQDFRDPITIRPRAMVEKASETPPAPPPAPTFSETELEDAKAAARKTGYGEGFEAGLLQANTESTAREKEMAGALAKIVQQLQTLSNYYTNYMDKQAAEVGQLALLIARKAAEDALDTRGTEMIAAMVKQCLPVFLEKPKVAFEMHPDTLANAQEPIKGILTQQGFEGDAIFRPNESLGKHDARVDWGNGQATRSMETLWRDIEALIYQSTPPTQ